jgi:hypothetical protein
MNPIRRFRRPLPAGPAHLARVSQAQTTIQLCIHCRHNPAGSHPSGQTVGRPWRLSCCQDLPGRAPVPLPEWRPLR